MEVTAARMEAPYCGISKEVVNASGVVSINSNDSKTFFFSFSGNVLDYSILETNDLRLLDRSSKIPFLILVMFCSSPLVNDLFYDSYSHNAIN